MAKKEQDRILACGTTKTEIPYKYKIMSSENPDFQQPAEAEGAEETANSQVRRPPQKRESIFPLGKKTRRAAGILALTGVLLGGGAALKKHESGSGDDQETIKLGDSEYRIRELKEAGYDEVVLTHADKVSKYPWGEKAILDAARGNAKVALLYAGQYLPYLKPDLQKKLIAEVTDVHPEETIKYFRGIKNIPGSEEVLRTAIGRVAPRYLIESAEHYRYLPDSEFIFKNALQTLKNDNGYDYAVLFLDEYRNYKNYGNSEEILRESLELALKHPSTGFILRSAGEYINLPWAREYIIKAARADPLSTLRNFEKIKSLPQSDELLREAIKESLANPSMIFFEELLSLFDTYKHLPEAEEVLREAGEKSIKNEFSSAFLSNIERFPKKPWVAELVAKQAEKSPEMVLELNKAFAALPGGPQILEKAARFLAENHPQKLLNQSERIKDQPWFTELITIAATKNPVEAIENFKYYSHIKNAEEILKTATDSVVKKNPTLILLHVDQYLGWAWGKKYIKDAAERDPDTFLRWGAYYHVEKFPKELKIAAEKALPGTVLASGDALIEIGGKNWATDLIKQAAKKNKGAAVRNFTSYHKIPGAKEIFLTVAKELAQTSPSDVMSENLEIYNLISRDEWSEVVEISIESASSTNPEVIFRAGNNVWEKSPPASKPYLNNAILNDPVGAFSYVNSNESIRRFCAESTNPDVRRVFELIMKIRPYAKIGGNYNEYSGKENVLLVTVLNPTITVEQAVALVRDKQQFDNFVIDAWSTNQKYGRVSLNKLFSNSALRQVREINYRHEDPDRVRFKSVENYGVKQLYLLMTYGEEEIFTSSYNGLFNRLLGKMQKEHLSAEQLFQAVGDNKYRTFVKLASQFNRLNEFLALASNDDARKNILKEFVKNIEIAPDRLAQAVAVADTFSILSDPSILQILQKQIKEEYERVSAAKNKQGVEIYGLLAGMFGKKAVVDDAWIREMAEKYKLPNLLEIESSKLFNSDGSNIQEYFFYNDPDGKSSFQSLLAQYKGQPDWKIEENQHYVLIRSEGPSGKRIELYANRPEYESEGTDEIQQIFQKRKVQSIVAVHRGHSYHAAQTIKRISSIAKIVHLGSCGGYSNVSAVLERSADAHIISTKGLGTMQVNDPLLKSLNTKIRSGQNINWPKFWAEMEQKVSDKNDFRNYVPPHRNLGTLFLKAYNQRILQ